MNLMHIARIWLLFSMLDVASGDEQSLEECIGLIFQRYFNKTSLLVYDGRRRQRVERTLKISPPNTVNLDAILKLINSQETRAVDVSDRRSRHKKSNRYKMAKSQSSLFIFDEDESFKWDTIYPFLKIIKSRTYYNRQGPSLVIVYKNHTSTSEYNSEGAKNIIASIWRWNKSVNLVVMVAEPNKYFFYTWFPYRLPGCRWVFPDPPYDIWTNSTFLYNKYLYPVKIKKDLEGCILRVASGDCTPYTFDNYTSGFEASLVRTLSEDFNFTMQKIPVPKKESLWTTSYPNGTTAGAFGLLDRQEVDLAYACLMLNLERYNLAECLPTYYHDSLTWFIPTPDRKSHASNIFDAFPETYWIAIVITAVAALIVFLLISKLEEYALTEDMPESLTGAVLRVFAMAISSPITLSSKNTLLRIFTFAFAIYSLHITTVYQASLYSLYKTDQYHHIYHDLQEVVDHNLFFWLKESTKNLYNKEDQLFKKIMQPGRHDYLGDNLEEAFDEVAYDKKSTVLFIKTTMLTYISSYYLDDSKQPLILYLPVQFASYPVTLFLSPGHPMFVLMSVKMQHIVESGLISFWLSEVVKEVKGVASALVTNSKSLQLEHLGGAFMFYAALISVASGFFLLELLYWLTHGKKVKKRLEREEINIRRQLLFRTVVSLSRDQITRFSRSRTKK